MQLLKNKICLVEFTLSYPRAGSLTAYHEVIESYFWGFSALGYQVERRGNGTIPDAINLIFGYHIPYQLGLIDKFPLDSIFLNFERMADEGLLNEVDRIVGQKFQVWEYSEANLPIWRNLGTKYPVYFAQVSYAPVLEKIPKNLPEDIDVLFYGSLSPARLNIIGKITKLKNDLTSISVMCLLGVYGPQRDEFIARSKIIINVSSQVNFEIVRVSYLLANKKAVVCVVENEQIKIDNDLSNDGLMIVGQNEVYAACEKLLVDNVDRNSYSENCYNIFKKRDVRKVIENFFGAMNLKV